jgi:hypothetical protein
MSDTTTHLGLPYLLAAQAQKHVTHNEALRLLDAMVQLSVLDRTRTAPPASPADGNRHLVASGATGLWAGWDLNIACRIDGAWIGLVPRVGWQVWVTDEGVPLVWTGSAWQDVADRPLQVPRIGVNASSDTTHRLSVNSPGVLLNHAGAGIEATVNKAAAGNDAAFAFRTGFSARARIGADRLADAQVKLRLLRPRADRPPRQRRFQLQGQPGWLGLLRRDPDRPHERPGGTAEADSPAGAGGRAIPAALGQGLGLRPQPHRSAVDRRDARFGSGLPPAAAFRGEPHRQLVALDRHHDHHRGPADHLGRHRLAPDAGRYEPRRLDAALAPDLGGGGRLGR